MREVARPRRRPIRTKEQVARARAARQSPSVAEEIVWQLLRARKEEFKFRREHPIGPYRLDFYCAEVKVCVELDGEQHSPERDHIRDLYLDRLGIVTYRIPNVEFFHLDPSAPYRDHISEVLRICKSRRLDR